MNHLQQHPFRPIPGVNPELPVNQQIEQIEQLNTLLLQEIDANFAKFHQIITSRILPQIKRYAIAAEPVREGAKFWKTFYEAAADVHVQIASDQSLATTEQEESISFHNATSSTPLHARTRYDDSMSESMASPFDTLDRRLQESMHLEDSLATPSLPSGYDMSVQSSASSIPLPQPSLSYTPKAATPRRPKYSLADLDDADDDDLPVGMSPPVTLQFTLAPRASEMMATGLEAQKPEHQEDAAKRIVDDLVEEMTYVPSPKMPTPDAFRRYSIAPPQSDSRTFHHSPNSTFDSDIDGLAEPEAEEHVYDDTFDSTASSISISPFGQPAPAQGAARSQSQFNLHKQDEMLTFFGGDLLEAAGRDVADTPTHARHPNARLG